MKTVTKHTLSTAITLQSSAQRTTAQTLHVLTFIHRFRHVTARHIQTSLRHAHVPSTHNQLSLLRAKGYVARQYYSHDHSSNRAASYYLTPAGLAVLQTQEPNRTWRPARSLAADVTMRLRQIEHYHALADVYCHFKTHYDGHFEFFTAFDIAGLPYMPDEVPDGYVRTTIPGSKTQHYLIEIYGWSRSTHNQNRRVYSYLQFAESDRWSHATGEPTPSLFVVTGSEASQRRIHTQLAHKLQESLADNLRIYTTTRGKLTDPDPNIWRAV